MLKKILRIPFIIETKYKLKKYTIHKGVRFNKRVLIVNNNNKSSFELGENLYLADSVLVCEREGEIKIGDCVFIGANSYLRAVRSIHIGNYTLISENVVIMDTNSHPISRKMRRKQVIEFCKYHKTNDIYEAEAKPVKIGDEVWVGRNSMILKGVTIGNGSIVTAGSVVTKDIPPNKMAGGNPARIIKDIE